MVLGLGKSQGFSFLLNKGISPFPANITKEIKTNTREVILWDY